MAANRYDQAAEMPILNTYVPIDFGNLYRIGATQKAAIDDAINQFGTAVTTFGEFRSPSQVDTQRYYDLTIGRKDMQDLIQGMVNNPDLIKDSAFRSKLNSVIYNTDFAALSDLQQSKEGLLARQKANQQLMLQGGYNPLIHDVDYSNYDTLQSGIYNDISPLPYTSVVEMVKPYVDNLKDSFMGVQDGWIHRGVSADRTDAQINANWSNIINTPGYSQNLEIIMKQNPGISTQDATDILNNQIILAGREFTRDEAERDPWSLYMMKKQWEASIADPATKMKNLTDLVHEDANRKYRQLYGNFTDPEAKYRWIEYGIQGLTEEERKELQPQITQNSIVTANRNLFMSRMETYGGNGWNAARDVAMAMSTPLGTEAAQIFTKQGAGTGKQYSDGSYEVSNIKTFTPLDETGFNMAGIDLVSEVPNKQVKNQSTEMMDLIKKRKQLWNAPDLQAKVIPAGYAVSDGYDAKNVAYLYIPYKQVKKYMNDADIITQGGSVVTRSFDEVSITQSVTYDYQGNVDRSSTVKRGKEEQYVRFVVTNNIASKGQAAMEADAIYNKYTGLSSDTRDTQVQQSQWDRSTPFDWIPPTIQYDPELN